MMIQFHTPSGPWTMDTATVTTQELEAVGLTWEDIAPQLAEAYDKARATELLASSPEVITQPEMWELLRIYGRWHGLAP